MIGSGMVRNPKRVVWFVRCVPIVENEPGSRLLIETLWRRRYQAFMSGTQKRVRGGRVERLRFKAVEWVALKGVKPKEVSSHEQVNTIASDQGLS
jgi:hypothetical protein